MARYGYEWALRLLPSSRHGDRGLVDAVAAMAARHPVEAIVAQGHAGARRPDYGNLLPRIRCPALIAAGALDALRPIEPHRHMAGLIPDARLVIIENAGHMMMMEEPEQVSDALRKWVARVSRS